MCGIEVVVADAGAYLDQAGRIWAEATAARDGDSDLPPLDAARAVIEQAVHSSARSLLLIALGQDACRGSDPPTFALIHARVDAAAIHPGPRFKLAAAGLSGPQR